MSDVIGTEIIQRLKEARRARLEAAYEDAACDPAYVAEMMEIEADFSVTLADGLDSDES